MKWEPVHIVFTLRNEIPCQLGRRDSSFSWSLSYCRGYYFQLSKQNFCIRSLKNAWASEQHQQEANKKIRVKLFPFSPNVKFPLLLSIKKGKSPSRGNYTSFIEGDSRTLVCPLNRTFLYFHPLEDEGTRRLPCSSSEEKVSESSQGRNETLFKSEKLSSTSCGVELQFFPLWW